MPEIKIINGEEVVVYGTTITQACILDVSVGTTGYCGGDTGHGGRTYFKLSNVACTDMHCKIVPSQHHDGGVDEIEIEFGGDMELDNFIDALEFALRVLKFQREMPTTIGRLCPSGK